MDKSHLFKIVLAKNRIIINDLENFIFSITLAKANLINPVILDEIDIKETNHEKLTNFSITDLLEISQIIAFQYNDMTHFLIKHPKPNLVRKKISIYPIQHYNRILDFGENNLVADCGRKPFAIHQCGASMTLQNLTPQHALKNWFPELSPSTAPF